MISFNSQDSESSESRLLRAVKQTLRPILLTGIVIFMVSTAVSFFHQREVETSYRSAYQEVQRMYRSFEKAKATADEDEWLRLGTEIGSRRALVLSRTATAPQGSAGHHIAGALRMLETLVGLHAKQRDRPDSGESMRVIEERFLEQMKLAQHQLSLD